MAAGGTGKVGELAADGARRELLFEQRRDRADERADAPDTTRQRAREELTHRQNDRWREATAPQPRQYWRCGPF